MRAWLLLALLLPLAVGAQAPGFGEGRGGRSGAGEAQVQLPPFPKPEDYLPFRVSETTPFSFFVDAKSISVVADREVRYTLIAKSTEGALNISFEGMRCVERDFRIYALGRSDLSWSKPRNSRWEPIRRAERNSERAALFDDYFCPVDHNLAGSEEAVRALRSGSTQRRNTLNY